MVLLKTYMCCCNSSYIVGSTLIACAQKGFKDWIVPFSEWNHPVDVWAKSTALSTAVHMIRHLKLPEQCVKHSHWTWQTRVEGNDFPAWVIWCSFYSPKSSLRCPEPFIQQENQMQWSTPNRWAISCTNSLQLLWRRKLQYNEHWKTCGVVLP